MSEPVTADDDMPPTEIRKVVDRVAEMLLEVLATKMSSYGHLQVSDEWTINLANFLRIYRDRWLNQEEFVGADGARFLLPGKDAENNANADPLSAWSKAPTIASAW